MLVAPKFSLLNFIQAWVHSDLKRIYHIDFVSKIIELEWYEVLWKLDEHIHIKWTDASVVGIASLTRQPPNEYVCTKTPPPSKKKEEEKNM